MVARNSERARRFGRFAATAGLLTLANVCAVGCGGTSVTHAEAGRGGDDGGAGMNAAANGGTTAGALPVAGHGGAGRSGSGAGGVSASGGSSRGGSSVGAAGGTGRAGAGAGGAGTGGTSGGTAGSAGTCPVLDCDDVPCPDGVLIAEECACPVCRCQEVGCAVQDCADGQQPILRPGACCPVCPEPDIDACDTDSDCVLARSLLECCGCPEAVSRRHYEQDSCLWIQDEPRDIPDDCVIPCPEIVCAPCPEQASICNAGLCTSSYPQR